MVFNVYRRPRYRRVSKKGIFSTSRTFQQIINATCTTATSFGPKTIGKIVTVASTTATSFIKAVSKTVPVTSTTATSVIKSVGKIVNVTSTTATAPILKTVNKIVNVSSITSTSLTAFKLLHVTINVACHTATNVVKSVGKNIFASLSSLTFWIITPSVTPVIKFGRTGRNIIDKIRGGQRVRIMPLGI